MIDEKGKLFGKINLIDLLIVLIIIAAVVFAVNKVNDYSDKDTNAQKVMISFTGDKVPMYASEALKEGVTVLDDKESADIGVLDSFKYEKMKDIVVADNGTTAEIEDDYSTRLTINILADGTIGDHGVEINDALYGIGHTTVLYAGDVKLFLAVSDIQPVE